MNRSRSFQALGLGVTGAFLLAAGLSARAETGVALCELTIRGHSIVRLTLTERANLSQVRFENPGETVRLPAGHYRVERVDLRDGYSMLPRSGRPGDWFEVSREGPNELVVGAPLFPSASVRRYGAFLQLDYDTVDGAGRSYEQQRDPTDPLPPAPRFAVFKDGEQIGSGTFEYG